jgi:DNA modification methylase
MKQQVFHGNNLELLKQYPDNYFDAIVTDPPYGLGKEPNAEEMLQAWITSGYLEVKGSGFMGKEWDAFVPQPIFWKEVFRTLKHGGHVVSFFGTRTYDWGVMAMRLAGFEIRDCIQWIYGSGFPKSHNISKAIDKSFGAEREVVGEIKRGDVERAKQNGSGYLSDPANRNNEKQFGYGIEEITIPSTDQAKQWDGWGTALKPANEPIVLARKPLEKGLSIAENVMKWGTGGINIDECRVGNLGGTQRSHQSEYPKKEDGTEDRSKHWATVGHDIEELKKGRFPANLILTHHPECDCKGLKKVKPSNGSGKASENGGGFSKGMFGNGESDKIGGGFTDENGQETIEDWTCHEDCPIRIMDAQSGVTLSSGGKGNKSMGAMGKNGIYGNYALDKLGSNAGGLGDKGGASRFFYCAKASKSERNKGLIGFEEKISGSLNFRNPSSSGRSEDAPSIDSMGGLTNPQKNFHPTVKPVALMQYLVRMITPPNGIVLDPFNGSGTTGIACKLEGFEYVGMELDAEYCKIAQARIDNFVPSDLDYSHEVKQQNEEEQTDDDKKDQLSLF